MNRNQDVYFIIKASVFFTDYSSHFEDGAGCERGGRKKIKVVVYSL